MQNIELYHKLYKTFNCTTVCNTISMLWFFFQLTFYCLRFCFCEFAFEFLILLCQINCIVNTNRKLFFCELICLPYNLRFFCFFSKKQKFFLFCFDHFFRFLLCDAFYFCATEFVFQNFFFLLSMFRVVYKSLLFVIFV